MSIRKEEVLSLMLAEAFDGIFIHKVWILLEAFGKLELLVTVEVVPGLDVEDFVRMLFRGERPRYQQVSNEIKEAANDLFWCRHMATLWHYEGCCVLMTCQVP